MYRRHLYIPKFLTENLCGEESFDNLCAKALKSREYKWDIDLYSDLVTISIFQTSSEVIALNILALNWDESPNDMLCHLLKGYIDNHSS